MLEAIILLEAEVERIMKLAVVLRQTGLPIRAEYREREAGRLRVILDMLDISKVQEYNTFYMKSVTKILAKEVRRIRALVELMEKYNGSTHRIHYRKAELGALKRILALAIKEKL